MQILALHALRDNYIFVILDRTGTCAAVVDPGEAAPVLAWLTQKGLELSAILLTHHHADHTGGVAELVSSFPQVTVIGSGDDPRLPCRNLSVTENSVVSVCGFEARVLDLSAHTRHHIAFHFAASNDLFSGDTLFAGTCGNIFEGTPADMFQALSKIRTLSDATRIWCAHEYTLYFLPEAERLEPWNTQIAPRVERMREKMSRAGSTIPLLLAEEKATNPFLHWDDLETCARLQTSPGLETFERIIVLSG